MFIDQELRCGRASQRISNASVASRLDCELECAAEPAAVGHASIERGRCALHSAKGCYLQATHLRHAAGRIALSRWSSWMGGIATRLAPRRPTRIPRNLEAGQYLHIAGKPTNFRQREAFAPVRGMKFRPLRSERVSRFLFALFALSRLRTLRRVSWRACARRPDVQRWRLIGRRDQQQASKCHRSETARQHRDSLAHALWIRNVGSVGRADRMPLCGP
jgi:hypothetical protein